MYPKCPTTIFHFKKLLTALLLCGLCVTSAAQTTKPKPNFTKTLKDADTALVIYAETDCKDANFGAVSNNLSVVVKRLSAVITSMPFDDNWLKYSGLANDFAFRLVVVEADKERCLDSNQPASTLDTPSKGSW